MGKVQRRDAGLVGGIPTQAMRPHMRLAHQSYAERGIAGRVGMRRSAAIRARATVGSTGPEAERRRAETCRVRNGRPRRQSRDWREGRT